MKPKLLLGILALLIVVLIFSGCAEETGKQNGGQSPVTKKEVKVEEVKAGHFTVTPTSAICGYKRKTGPALPAGKMDTSEDCLAGVLKEGDELEGYASKPGEKQPDEIGVGVAEIYFEIPQEIADKGISSATVELKLICSSGIGLYFLTEFDEWARFGEGLPSDQYKPDGSYGYLSCRYGARERKAVSVPIEINNGKAGVRIVKEEATAYAFIDLAKLTVVTGTG